MKTSNAALYVVGSKMQSRLQDRLKSVLGDDSVCGVKTQHRYLPNWIVGVMDHKRWGVVLYTTHFTYKSEGGHNKTYIPLFLLTDLELEEIPTSSFNDLVATLNVVIPLKEKQ